MNPLQDKILEDIWRDNVLPYLDMKDIIYLQIRPLPHQQDQSFENYWLAVEQHYPYLQEVFPDTHKYFENLINREKQTMNGLLWYNVLSMADIDPDTADRMINHLVNIGFAIPSEAAIALSIRPIKSPVIQIFKENQVHPPLYAYEESSSDDEYVDQFSY